MVILYPISLTLSDLVQRLEARMTLVGEVGGEKVGWCEEERMRSTIDVTGNDGIEMWCVCGVCTCVHESK